MAKKDKSAIRFGVRSADRRESSIWKLWTNKSDVYLLGREFRDTVKVSLHESGWCQYSYTSKEAEKLKMQPAERHKDQWKRVPNYEAGFAVVFKIFVPEEDLREVAWRHNKPIIWIPAPYKGYLTEIALVFNSAGMPSGLWPGIDAELPTQLIKAYALPNGEHLWVVYRNYEVKAEMAASFAKGRKEALEEQVKNPLPPALSGKKSLLKAAGYGIHRDGSRSFTDLSLEPEYHL